MGQQEAYEYAAFGSYGRQSYIGWLSPFRFRLQSTLQIILDTTAGHSVGKIFKEINWSLKKPPFSIENGGF
ncbi:hypothetical protein [Oscillibacter sp.]|uniref:hypothetical protein n=1 Tax=Oscillibacter sp. TaxID=1945593 RepID=UPI002896FC59|nr:hypothetical protein [Oscillibacter sp.]